MQVLELRNYLLKPGTRDEFAEYFEKHFVDSQNVLGGRVLGQFTVAGEDDKFFWMRGFENMRRRLEFLRAFYEQGAIWKQHGANANEMMLNSDDVYLLKPLNVVEFDESEIRQKTLFVAIDFYFAKNNLLDKLAEFFRTNFVPALERKPTLWVSEMSANDFPRLPVIQNENLLVAITTFDNESDLTAQSNNSLEFENRMHEFLARHDNLILRSTNGRSTKC